MTWTWSDGDETQLLRARLLAGYSIRDDVPFGALLQRLCDLVERTEPPPLPDELEVRPVREPVSLATLSMWEPSPNEYVVRVRLAGVEYRFSCVRPDRPTERAWLVAMQPLEAGTPTLRQALEQCRDRLQAAYDNGDAGEAVLEQWHSALVAANAALGSPL